MKNDFEVVDAISWTSYHASNQYITENYQTTLTQLIPLFYEKAATAIIYGKQGMVVHYCSHDQACGGAATSHSQTWDGHKPQSS